MYCCHIFQKLFRDCLRKEQRSGRNNYLYFPLFLNPHLIVSESTIPNETTLAVDSSANGLSSVFCKNTFGSASYFPRDTPIASSYEHFEMGSKTDVQPLEEYLKC